MMTSAQNSTLEMDPIRALLNGLPRNAVGPSAYDTAWIAMLADRPRGSSPKFPQCLYWLVRNQLEDGSWGDPHLFHIYDRLVCTLAAIIALQKWRFSQESIAQGREFILRQQNAPTGAYPATVAFELILPRLIDLARQQDLGLPQDSPLATQARAVGARKLKKIPLEDIYSRPTTLLHSLEAIGASLDCERVLCQLGKNGAFLNSPSATAFVYDTTRDDRCEAYLEQVLRVYDGSAPVNYPIDIFETLWVIDQVVRSGRADSYQTEIKRNLDRIYPHLTANGMPWSEYVTTPDLDDTAVAYRLFRRFGYGVSDSVFEYFLDEQGAFRCFPGELDSSPSHMLNLLITSSRHSDGSALLSRAATYARERLQEFRQKRLSFMDDKWVIRDCLTSDIDSELEGNHESFSLPAREAWIDKTLYRVSTISHPSLHGLGASSRNLRNE